MQLAITAYLTRAAVSSSFIPAIKDLLTVESLILTAKPLFLYGLPVSALVPDTSLVITLEILPPLAYGVSTTTALRDLSFLSVALANSAADCTADSA